MTRALADQNRPIRREAHRAALQIVGGSWRGHPLTISRIIQKIRRARAVKFSDADRLMMKRSERLIRKENNRAAQQIHNDSQKER